MSKELAQSNKKLVIDINRTWESALSDSKSATNKSVLTGEKLSILKKNTPHGEWENQFKNDSNTCIDTRICLSFTIHHAQKLMRIAANKDLIKFVSDGDFLTIGEMTKAINEATPEQIAQVEQLKKEEADRIALAEANKALAEAKAAIDNAKKQDDVIDGVFVEVKKPEPVIVERPVEDPLDILQETIDMLEADNAILQTEMASIVKVLDANDQLTAALAEVKKFQELARVLKESLNGSMNSENAAKRQAKMWKAKYEKLAKEVGRE